MTANYNNSEQKLQFAFPGISTFKNQSKLSKCKTLTDNIIKNQILKKNSQIDELIKKFTRDSEITNCNPLYSQNNKITTDSNEGVQPTRKCYKSGSINSNRRKNNHLQRYKTYSEDVENNNKKNYSVSVLNQIGNININFNINNENNIELPLSGEKIIEESSEVQSSPKVSNHVNRQKSRRWKNYKNLIKVAKGFTEHDVTKIDNPNDLEFDIEKYKKIKEKFSSVEKSNSRIPTITNFIQKPEINKELIRVHLKESAYKIITEGSKNFSEKLDELFMKNQERYIFDNNHPNFLFNQPLSVTKKTLFYTACQEGNYAVVEYFLHKNLLPSIKSMSDDNEFETCLEVAVRWNYYDIVKLLLEKGKIPKLEVISVSKKKNISKPIKKLINKYLGKNSQSSCACF